MSEQKTQAWTNVKKNTTIQVIVSSGLVGDKLTIPNVSGRSESEAQSMLEQAGFNKISSEFEYSDTVAEGDVINTTPTGGSEATKDTQIVMKVSKGAEKKTVPNVIGKADADAQYAIVSAGLNVGTVSYDYNDNVPEGQVVSQSIDGGKKVAAGTAVGISVSLGPKPAEKVSVPPVTDTSLENARQLINSAGLSVGDIYYAYSDTVAAGNVISCEPGVGNSVEEGTLIELIVSQGPEEGSGTGTDYGYPSEPDPETRSRED